jgi:hypothetical protein
MKTQDMLKEKLLKIKNNNYSLAKDDNIYAITMDMLKYIGSTDSQLRDDLIYDISAEWISNDLYSKEGLINLLYICLDEDHLFYKIGERDTDSVFTRSFSALFIANIIDSQRRNNFLANDDLIKTITDLIKYTIEEKDTRGYIEDKGWAHSTAHTADALSCLVKCSFLNRHYLLAILDAVKNKMSINDYVYIDHEDERITNTIISLINRNVLSEEDLIQWIYSFKKVKYIGKLPNDQYQITNIKNFLRSFYFRLIDNHGYLKITYAIKLTLYDIYGYKFN